MAFSGGRRIKSSARMVHRYRTKSAWISYLSIQTFWVLCALLTPVAVSLWPSKLWALPFCTVTAAGGLHMTFFWREYNALLRKMMRLVPFSRLLIRYLTPSQRDPSHFLTLGVIYTLAGIVSAALVIFY